MKSTPHRTTTPATTGRGGGSPPKGGDPRPLGETVVRAEKSKES